MKTEEEIKKEFDNIRTKSIDLNEKYNPFVTICDYEHINSDSKLNGVMYALKDNFSTKGILTTASSNILKNYIPIYDSTVYKKLKESGAVLVGKTVLDELAMGGTGTTGHTGIVRNPYDPSRIIGGSSAGSACAVALDLVKFAIGSDTGDSVRKPACYGGIVGFKPTYGRISRYGLFPFASSLDHVGIFAKNVKDITVVTDIIKGYDEKDMTSLKDDNEVYENHLNDQVKGKKLFYIKEILDVKTDNKEVNENIKSFYENIEKIKSLGVEVYEETFNKDLLNSILGVYFSISCAEATSNNSNLTGIHFGKRESGKNYKEIMINSRTKGFSELIKRRFILGSYILKRENQEKLYLNALRVRRLIVNEMNKLFEKYDGLILPASAGIAPKIEGKKEEMTSDLLLLDNHMAIGNFGGYPSITLPSSLVEGMPVGINITFPCFKDSEILNMAFKIEEVINFKGGK